jgi:sulfur carrier protein
MRALARISGAKSRKGARLEGIQGGFFQRDPYYPRGISKHDGDKNAHPSLGLADNCLARHRMASRENCPTGDPALTEAGRAKMALEAMGTIISIHLNGEKIDLAARTIGELVNAQGWSGRRIAIERNGAIVPRSCYADTALCSGDTLEVVVAVGGG